MTPVRRRSSGGPAAGGGFNFQAAVTAIALSHTASGTQLGWLDGLARDVPIEVAAETSGPGDDLHILLEGGEQVEAQVKRSIRAHAELWDVLLTLARTVTAHPATYGLLLVGPGSSASIRQGLAGDLSRIGAGVTGGLKPLAEEWIERLQAENLDPQYVSGRLRIVTLAAIATESADVRSAMSELGHICGDRNQRGCAWDRLYREAFLMIEGRGRRTARGIAQVLRSAGVRLRHDEEARSPAALLERLSTWAASINSEFSIIGVDKALPIDSAWIPVSPIVKDDLDDRLVQLPDALAHYHQMGDHPDAAEGDCAPETLGRFYTRCVIMAGPGSGKSTLLRKLARVYAQEGFPVLRVSARELARRMRATGAGFEEALFNLGLDGSGVSIAAATDATLPDWVFLVDGLDEAGGDQALLAEGLLRLSQGMPDARFIVTTRPVGYQPAHLSRWRHYELATLDQRSSARHMARLLEHILPTSDERRPLLIELLEEALEQSGAARAAIRTPLLLSLSAALFAQREQLGRTKHGFYSAIFQLLEREPPPRAGEKPAGTRVLSSALNVLGWTLTAAPLASREACVLACGRTLAAELQLPLLAAEELADRCLSYWTALGLLEELQHSSGPVLTFVHKTFQEFAAARYFAQLPRAEQARLLDQYRDEPDWREVISFGAALGAGEVVLAGFLSQGFAHASGQQRLIQAIEIIGRCEPPPSEGVVRRVLESAIARLEEDHVTWASEAALALAEIAPRWPDLALQHARPLLNHPQPWTRAGAWAVSTAARSSAFDVDELLDVLAQLDPPTNGTNDGLEHDEPTSWTNRDVLQSFAFDIAQLILVRYPAEQADEIIHRSLRTRRLQTVGFLVRMERLLSANGLTYKWRSEDAAREGSQPQIPSNIHLLLREAFEGLVCGLHPHPPSSAPTKQRRLYTLAALFTIVGLRTADLGDLWGFRHRGTAAAAAPVWRAVVSVAGLPIDELVLEAGELLSMTRAGEIDSLLAFSEWVPDVDVPEPDWQKAQAADLDFALIAAALEQKSWLISRAALKILLAAENPSLCRQVAERLISHSSPLASRAASELARHLPRHEARELLYTAAAALGAGSAYIFDALAALRAEDDERFGPVIGRALLNEDVDIATAAAHWVSKVPERVDPVLLTRSYDHWQAVEAPSPQEFGVVPQSPRAPILRALLSVRHPALEDVLGYLSDPRHDIRALGRAELLRRATAAGEERLRIAESAVRLQIPIESLGALLRRVCDWTQSELEVLLPLLNHKDGAVRLASMPLLDAQQLGMRHRTSLLAALRHDRAPAVREAAITRIANDRIA